MNIAFASIVLILIFSPGILFRRLYYSADFSIKFNDAGLFEEILRSIIPAFFIQIIFIYLIIPFVGYKIDFKILLTLLISNKDNEINFVIKNISEHIGQIFIYNLSICILSVFIGFFSRKYILKMNLDIVMNFFN
jgi:hypothetical protein